jgi:hypothetical protein
MRATGFIALLLFVALPACAGEKVQAPDSAQVQQNSSGEKAVRQTVIPAPKPEDKPEKPRQDNKKSGLLVDEPEPPCGEE